MSGIIASAVVGVGGLAVACFTLWLNFRQKEEENFLKALDWMSGRTQRRNLGIAAIESKLGSTQRTSARWRSLCIPTLCSSAMYLLTASKQGDSPQELDNLTRMMRLLLDAPPKNSADKERYGRLLVAVERAKTDERDKALVVPPSSLKTWSEELRNLGVQSSPETVRSAD